jgi:TetR/AcrR family transcriptional regulator, regulator of autoinduction and epiphytic fitness
MVPKRDTSKKRDSILQAATRVFISEGYDGASMDRISEMADASKRTVYDHFPSKDALFRAVIDRFLRQSHELKQVPYQPKRSLGSQLESFADAIIALTLNPEWLGLVKVMTSVVAVQPDLVLESMARVHIKEDALENWLKDASRDGRMQVGNPGLAAQAFWACLNGNFLMPAIYTKPLPKPATDALKKELIQMLLARYESAASVAGASRRAGKSKPGSPP